MFDPIVGPRVFALPPGADFTTELAHGLLSRANSQAELAKTVVYVNSARMQRSLRDAFRKSGPMLLPKIRLITDISSHPTSPAPTVQLSPLRRKLELAQLIRALLEADPTRAPKSAVYDLADSLIALMDEMQGEGVAPESLMQLDVNDESGHWQTSIEFFRILKSFFDQDDSLRDGQAQLRAAAKHLSESWLADPPKHPIVVAGSTGSRGAAQIFMKAVAQLPQGALLLPGFDFDQPVEVWKKLRSEDHPQYRYKALLQTLESEIQQVMPWDDGEPKRSHRNRMISLALRPAPVTKDWINEGPALSNLHEATEGMALLEAENPRAEAETIALRMRQAVEDDQTVALISPDRMLTRQVAAALDRWNIVSDDSAGTPLAQSPPGRLLLQLAAMAGAQVAAHSLLTLLKHPLVASSDESRGNHLRWTREFELSVRKDGPPFPNRTSISAWAAKMNEPGCNGWAEWVSSIIEALEAVASGPLGDLAQLSIDLAQLVSAGPNQIGSGGLWDKAAGRTAREVCDLLVSEADAGGIVSPQDFSALLRSMISGREVRDRDAGHPNVLIWGTLEARVQRADLVILGGLNEGVWPEAASPDPWLNRKMRQAVGLLLPERQIGLSAHDFQQAVAADTVWITRSKRSADAETVPSRWLNRLTNLLEGLPAQSGPEALEAMRRKANVWAEQAKALSRPAEDVEKAPRPSPCPPPHARPKSLSVTRIKTLIRDPYAIYAERILRLRALNPLFMEADAPLKGEVFHKVLEQYLGPRPDVAGPDAVQSLLGVAERVITEQCPWPSVRLRWLAQFENIAPLFIADEVQRQKSDRVEKLEAKGAIDIPHLDFKLTCIADRIDVTEDGRALIYDYKTGQVPTKDQQLVFDKQLLLETVMMSLGGFPDLGRRDVARAAFLAIKPDMKQTDAPLDEATPEKTWADFTALISRWQERDRGYTARMSMVKKDDVSYFDTLSRFGEWDGSDKPTKIVLT